MWKSQPRSPTRAPPSFPHCQPCSSSSLLSDRDLSSMDRDPEEVALASRCPRRRAFAPPPEIPSSSSPATPFEVFPASYLDVAKCGRSSLMGNLPVSGGSRRAKVHFNPVIEEFCFKKLPPPCVLGRCSALGPISNLHKPNPLSILKKNFLNFPCHQVRSPMPRSTHSDASGHTISPPPPASIRRIVPCPAMCGSRNLFSESLASCTT
jgi:hypothetical protein